MRRPKIKKSHSEVAKKVAENRVPGEAKGNQRLPIAKTGEINLILPVSETKVSHK